MVSCFFQQVLLPRTTNLTLEEAGINFEISKKRQTIIVVPTSNDDMNEIDNAKCCGEGFCINVEKKLDQCSSSVSCKCN